MGRASSLVLLNHLNLTLHLLPFIILSWLCCVSAKQQENSSLFGATHTRRAVASIMWGNSTCQCASCLSSHTLYTADMQWHKVSLKTWSLSSHHFPKFCIIDIPLTASPHCAAPHRKSIRTNKPVDAHRSRLCCTSGTQTIKDLWFF